MRTILKVTLVLLCTLLVAFTFMPTGTTGDDVALAYRTMSVEAMSQSGLTAIYYEDIEPGSEVTGTMQSMVEEAAQGSSGVELTNGHVDYCWVTSDGTPVRDYKPTSTFPKRGGTKDPYADYTGSGDPHYGTDACSATGNSQQIWQVAIWSGEVVEAYKDNSYGYTVLVKVDGTNTFYVRYAHMGYGNATTYGGTPKAWESGMSGSSLQVQKGDHVNAGDRLGSYGTTGSSTGNHCHIELILCPNGDGKTFDRSVYRASVANVLLYGKRLDEITWYNFWSKSAGVGQVMNFEDYWQEYEQGDGT